MTTDDAIALRALLIADEGYRLRMYADTRGMWTIGIGHNLSANGLPAHLVDALYEYDVAKVIAETIADLPWAATLDAVRFRVLINIAFNAGVGGLEGFHRMLAALQRGDHDTAANEIVNSALAPARAQRLAALMRT